jgi:competence protein ComEC
VRGPEELCGREHALGPARIQVLAPCPAFDPVRNVNDNSFVLRLAHGARSVLFTGDAEGEQEAWLLSQRARALASDVLKVGHHGSRTSSSEPFVEAVAPRLAVISAGRGNSFGHPHADVLERLQRHMPHVLRTDRVGGVQVWTDGRDLRVEAWARGVELEL